MARKPMITRTIKTTKVTVLGMDIVTAEPENRTVVLARTYPSMEKLLVAAKTAVETDTYKVVHVVSSEVIEQLYGMPEQQFVELAQPIIVRPADGSDVTAEPESTTVAD